MNSEPPQIPEHIKDEYPFENNYLDIGGTRMHYLDEGEGETVLMLHGNPSWSFYYRRLVKKLKGNMRCIVPDHIGCGLSDKPQDYEYRLKTHIANLETLLAHLKVKKYHLIVHDWGGMIGMGTAVKKPECVERMVILNTAAFLSSNIPLRINICRIPLLGELIIRGLNGFAGAAVHMATSNPMTEAVRNGFIFPYNNWHNRIATHRFVQDIPMTAKHPSYDLAKHIGDSLSCLDKKPTMLCWGAKDFCFDDTYYNEWKKRFPDAKTAYHKDAGHYVLEDMSDQDLEDIVTFLKV